MPSLPRIRRSRGRTGVAEAAARPRTAELGAQGLTWVHVTAPDQEVATEPPSASAGTGWMSRTSSRSAAAEGRRLPRVALRCPALPVVQQLGPAPERRRARHRARAGLPRHDAERSALPVDRLFNRCAEDEESATSSSRGLRPAAVRGARRLSTTAPDPRQDRAQARQDRGRHPRGALRGARARHLNVKQEINSYRKIMKPQRPTLRVLERKVERFLPEDLELYFDDIVDASERSGTCSTTTRRSSRRSRTRTSR